MAVSTNTTSRRALIAALAALPAAAPAALAAVPPAADAELLRLEVRMDVLYEALRHTPNDDAAINAATDEWVLAIENIADAEAHGPAGMRVKARALRLFTDGDTISCDENTIEGRLLRQVLDYVMISST